MVTKRLARISELLKREISQIVSRKVNDPRIGFITITNVKVSPDIKHARISVSVLGDEKSKTDSMNGLKSASKYIQNELSEVIKMKDIPELLFVIDNSLERGSRVINLMKKIRKNNNA